MLLLTIIRLQETVHCFVGEIGDTTIPWPISKCETLHQNPKLNLILSYAARVSLQYGEQSGHSRDNSQPSSNTLKVYNNGSIPCPIFFIPIISNYFWASEVFENQSLKFNYFFLSRKKIHKLKSQINFHAIVMNQYKIKN